MPVEAIGEIAVDAAGQLAIEGGGEAIKNRYGCKGCVVALLIVAALVAGAVYFIS